MPLVALVQGYSDFLAILQLLNSVIASGIFADHVICFLGANLEQHLCRSDNIVGSFVGTAHAKEFLGAGG